MRADDRWHVVGLSEGLPALDARCLAPDAEGSLWVGTSAGVARIGADLTATTYDLSSAGVGADDVRDLVADGPAVWVATAAGVIEVRGRDRVVGHPAATGREAECTAITQAEGLIWAATTQGIAVREADGTWATHSEVANATALTGSWSAPAFIPEREDGEREPHLVRARDGETLLLAASRRTLGPLGDTWQITLRSRQPDDSSWGSPLDLTEVGSNDHEPALLPRADGALHIFFRSDKGGGPRIWRVVIDAGGTVSDPARVMAGASADTNPAALVDGTTTLLLFRSDRDVDLRSLMEDAGPDPLGASRCDASRARPPSCWPTKQATSRTAVSATS